MKDQYTISKNQIVRVVTLVCSFLLIGEGLLVSSLGRSLSQVEEEQRNFLASSITAKDYVDFLNEVAVTDAEGLYDVKMGIKCSQDQENGFIIRLGSPSCYCYSVIEGREQEPIDYVSLLNSERYHAWAGMIPLPNCKIAFDQELRSNLISFDQTDRIPNNNEATCLSKYLGDIFCITIAVIATGSFAFKDRGAPETHSDPTRMNISTTTPWPQIVDQALQPNNLTAKVHLTEPLEKPIYYQDMPPQIEMPLSRDQTVQILTQRFEGHFRAQAQEIKNQLMGELGLQHEAAWENSFERQVETAVTSISNQYWREQHTPMSQRIQCVHRDALKALIALRKNFGKPAQLQIVSVGGAAQPSEEFTVIRPAPPLKNASLSGGGPRGVGYVGILGPLEEEGVLKHVDNVAGTSVGSFIAALLALGLPAKEIKAINDGMQISDMLRSSSNDTIHRSQTLWGCALNLTYVKEVVQQCAYDSIKQFFNSTEGDAQRLEQFQQNGTLTAEEKQELFVLKDTLQRGEILDPLITFRHLALLHKIAPQKFKKLIISAFNHTTQKVEYYHSDGDNPKMPIADAVRCSASLPFIFNPVVNEQGHKIYDGGLYARNPVEFFPKESREQTLMLDFEDYGEFNVKVYAPGGYQTKLSDRLMDLAKPAYGVSRSEVMQRDAANARAHGPNIIDVYHGRVTRGSFFASPQEVQAAQLQAEVRAWEWLFARQNQATYQKYENMDQLIQALTLEELQELVKPDSTSLLGLPGNYPRNGALPKRKVAVNGIKNSG